MKAIKKRVAGRPAACFSGYEWIDKDEVSVNGISAETDFSSLVLSAGLQFRF